MGGVSGYLLPVRRWQVGCAGGAAWALGWEVAVVAPGLPGQAGGRGGAGVGSGWGSLP